MVLRAVAGTRAAGLARSIDRGAPCRSVACDPECVRGSAARQPPGKPDQRSRRQALHARRLRGAADRQLRLGGTASASQAAAVMAELQNPPLDLKSGQVLFRFCVRMCILVAFSAFGGVGFSRSLSALLAMSTLLCAVLATVRREGFFGAELNYWDEAIAYAALYFLIGGINPPAPV